MEVPKCAGAYESPYLLIRGVHVTWIKVTLGIDGIRRPHLYTFDLSRRGWSTLPLRDEGDGTERRVLFEDGRQFLLQDNEGMVEYRFEPLGGGKFMHLVSRSRRWKCGGTLMLGKEDPSSLDSAVHVWELV